MNKYQVTYDPPCLKWNIRIYTPEAQLMYVSAKHKTYDDAIAWLRILRALERSGVALNTFVGDCP